MEGLISEVAQTFVTTGLFTALALVHSLPGSLANTCKLFSDATNVAGATGYIVKEDQGWQTYYVKTGRTHDHLIEVLSGLRGTETVALFGKDNV